MQLEALQGDVVIRKLDKKITGELDLAKDLVIAGSHSSPHTVVGAVRTRVEGDVRYLRVAKATTIKHADRHRTTKLAAGDYMIYPQRERGGNGDRAVED